MSFGEWPKTEPAGSNKEEGIKEQPVLPENDSFEDSAKKNSVAPAKKKLENNKEESPEWIEYRKRHFLRPKKMKK